MTLRDRLLAPFRRETPDRPPWVADLGYWYHAARKADRLDRRYQGREGFKRLHEDLGVCCYYGQGASVYTVRFDGVRHETRETESERIRWWRTPQGEIFERWRYLPRSCCWAHVEYAVKSIADLRVVADLFRRRRTEPDEHSFAAGCEFLGEAGIPLCPVPRSPLPALLTDWCGIMTTVTLLADEPQAVCDTLAVIEEANDAAFQLAAAGPAELLHFADNLDSSTSTSLFDDLMRTSYTRRLDQLHAAGKWAVVHLDGAVRGLLPKLAACGFDGVESLTPKPVGDVEPAELRTVAANDDVILWGGIPGALFCSPWTEAQVAEHTQRLLETLAGDGKLVVGTADQVPPDADLNLCRTITDLVENYPLRGD